MTFAYFYPRNDIMFINPMSAEAAAQAWRGWAAMNHVRSAVVLTAREHPVLTGRMIVESTTVTAYGHIDTTA